MATFQFKTNIKCGSCVATVTPFFEAEKRISAWSVDTEKADKILSVETDMEEADIIDLVEKAGYKVKERII